MGVIQLRGTLQQPGMQIEYVSGISLTSGGTADQQGKGTIGYRMLAQIIIDDEHILPLPADAYECAMSAERGWWQVIARETGERVYHGIGPVEVVVSPAPF